MISFIFDNITYHSKIKFDYFDHIVVIIFNVKIFQGSFIHLSVTAANNIFLRTLINT